MDLVRKIQEHLMREKTKKLLSIAVGISLVGLGASLLYHRFIFPRIHPQEYFHRKLKNAIEKQQSNQKSILFLDILKKIKISQNGISFNFSILQNLDKKPTNSAQGQTSDPFLPPFEEGLFVQHLSPTHSLLFNKFAVVRNHMLVVTTKFEAQNSLLNASDFTASQKVLKSLKGFWFFNSGPPAGASQPHKHIQVMPIEARQDTPILNVLSKRVAKLQGKVDNFAYIPFEFRHIIKVLRQMPEDENVEEYGAYLEECYIDCMNKLHNLEECEEGGRKIKHFYNMIISENFMLIVLRKQEKSVSYPQIAINGMGFTGTFLLKAHQEVKKDEEILPFKLLEEVSFSNSEGDIILQGTPVQDFNDILSVKSYKQ